MTQSLENISDMNIALTMIKWYQKHYDGNAFILERHVLLKRIQRLEKVISANEAKADLKDKTMTLLHQTKSNMSDAEELVHMKITLIALVATQTYDKNPMFKHHSHILHEAILEKGQSVSINDQQQVLYQAIRDQIEIVLPEFKKGIKMINS